MSVHVGVNLLWLVPDEVGGSGTYTLRCLEALTELDDPDLELTLFLNTTLAEDPACRPLIDAHRCVVAPTSGRSRAQRVAFEASWLGRQASRLRVDLVHEGGGTVGLWPRTRTLLTIHDLQPLELPENFSLTKRAYLRLMVPRSVRTATRIATLSEWVAHDVSERLHTDPSRFVRVPPGVVAPALPSTVEHAEVVRRYRLAEGGELRPFFFYPAITYPHKNHRMLIDAFAALARDDDRVLLVLAGGAGPSENDVMAAIERSGIEDQVRRTGRIPWRHVEVLYRLATAMVFPSRYEGCGIPAIEAMASGCAVIAADRTGLPETVGDAGVLVDADRPSAWCAAMAAMRDDPAQREHLVGLGTQRATRFDWTTSALSLAAAYRAVAAVGGGRAGPGAVAVLG